ncbi:MAG: hypothetical protein ACK5CE_06400, partial [Actinomycetes bacterium]
PDDITGTDSTGTDSTGTDITGTDITGTDITWCSSFRPAIRGTGWLVRAMMRRLVGRMSATLAAGAANVAAAAR